MKYALLISLLRLLALMPLPLSRWLGRCAGRLLWQVNPESRQVIELNLRLCFPEWSDQQRRQMARLRMQRLCEAAFEMGAVWLWRGHRIVERIHTVDGWSLVEQAQSEGRGVIFLAPHIGNWEVIGLYLATRVTNTNMYQPPDSPAMDALIRNSRVRMGGYLVPTSTVGVKALLKALRVGNTVGVLPDQVPPRDAGGAFAPFFGHPALTMTLLPNLIKRTGATVLTICAIGNRRGGWDLHIQSVPEAIGSTDDAASLAAMNTAVEQCARQFPEFYQWEYKRFRKQPDGSNPYRQLKERE